MDPNEALRALRDEIAAFRAAFEGDNQDAEHAAASNVADLAEAFDNWLTKGGSLTDDWKEGK